jgi:hypothetical protein
MSKKISILRKVQHVPLDSFDRELEFNMDFGIDVETLILSLRSLNEVQVLLLRYLGYTYKEIMTIMNFRSQGEYYQCWTELREDVERIQQN